jgi:undecaprenyl phosphate-alpha-L-ara4N flippase subunit ArnF
MVLFYGLVFSLFTALAVIVADVAIKLAADRAALASPHMMLGTLLYLISAILWFFAMRHISLGQATVAYSMLTLIALFLIGWIGFGEPAGGREIAGLGCALAAMALMSNAQG